MSKRSKTPDAAHARKRKNRSAAPRSTPGSHAPAAGEQAVDHSLEESFPASDPPAHGRDKPVDDADDAIDRGED